MNTLHVKYLLVGGGLASSAAAEAIRQHDPQGSVLLVAQENNRPYHRPALSGEYMRRERSRADLTTFPPGWMKEHDVELRTGRRVSYIDTNRASATLDNGQVVSFDHLLLATGASAKPLKIPGADLPSVYSLRTLDDADRLHHAIDTALREGHRHPRGVGRGRVAVIGGGLLGSELSASFTHLGLHVDLIVSQAHPWARWAGETTGALLLRHLQNHGVDVHVSHRAEKLDGDGRAQRVILASDEGSGGEMIETDLVVAAVGIVINRDILRDTPIAAETAVLVDQHCRTNVPNIYAAGDCAAVFDPLFGKHRNIDHWENALITGAIAGANMAGANEQYDHVNHFVSDLFGLHVNVWGERRFVHHRLVRGNAVDAGGEGSFVEFGVAADGRIAQVIKVGADGEDSNVLKQCIAKRLQVNGLEEQIKDPTKSLAEIVEQ
jgi:3-phenylpropionate/trans-cinnamate dioxygenase ferredoxin reductase component